MGKHAIEMPAPDNGHTPRHAAPVARTNQNATASTSSATLSRDWDAMGAAMRDMPSVVSHFHPNS